MGDFDWSDLAVGAAIALDLLWAVTYVLMVALGEYALRRGVPREARRYTFVGAPFGDRFYAPYRALAYFRDGGFLDLVDPDPAVIRRSRRARALVRANDALTYPAIAGTGLMLLVGWLGT